MTTMPMTTRMKAARSHPPPPRMANPLLLGWRTPSSSDGEPPPGRQPAAGASLIPRTLSAASLEGCSAAVPSLEGCSAAVIVGIISIISISIIGGGGDKGKDGDKGADEGDG